MFTQYKSDEASADFLQAMTNYITLVLEGVDVHIGVHPELGGVMVISPAMGDHLVVDYPFAGALNSL